jgi:FlaA1/EpsC-like NDP-sugar epimerase
MASDEILLISGGTGTVGNAVLRRFLKLKFKELRIFSRDVFEDLQLKKLNLKTMKAYHLRLNFQELWDQTA